MQRPPNVHHAVKTYTLTRRWNQAYNTYCDPESSSKRLCSELSDQLSNASSLLGLLPGSRGWRGWELGAAILLFPLWISALDVCCAEAEDFMARGYTRCNDRIFAPQL